MRYSASIQNTNATINQPAIEIIPPLNKVIRIVSIRATVTNAVFAPFSVGRTVIQGTPSAVIRGEAYPVIGSPSIKSGTTIAGAWTISPAAPSTHLAYLFVAGSVGASYDWRPSQPVAVSTSFVIWNLAPTTTATGFTIEWDED